MGDDGRWDESITTGTRYVTSTYLVMNALENSNTDSGARWQTMHD